MPIEARESWESKKVTETGIGHTGKQGIPKCFLVAARRLIDGYGDSDTFRYVVNGNGYDDGNSYVDVAQCRCECSESFREIMDTDSQCHQYPGTMQSLLSR